MPKDIPQCPGVYKIVFNNQWFYIGSSENVKKRFLRWSCALRKTQHLKNKNIKVILPLVDEVEFKILYTASSGAEAIKKEDWYLKQAEDNIYLLNRCPKGSTNKGIKPYFGQRLRPKKEKNPKGFNYRSVALFSSDGDLVKTFPTVRAAGDYLGKDHNKLSPYIRGEKKFREGIKLKYVSKDGSYIEHINPEQKRRNHKNGKFYQIDKDGNIVAEYLSVPEAAAAVDAMVCQIHFVLTKKPHYNTAKGFYWRYA